MNRPTSSRNCTCVWAAPARVKPTAPRRGLTLVELMAVIAIIGLLVGLLMPALQSARESSRRTTCTSNLKTMALASLAHLEHIGTFPSGGWPGGGGISASSGFNEEQGGGFLFNILPFMELESLRNLNNGDHAKQQSPLVIGCPTTVAPGVTARFPNGRALGVACYTGAIGSIWRYAPSRGIGTNGSCVITGSLSSLDKTTREATYPTFANYGHRVAGVNDFQDMRRASCPDGSAQNHWNNSPPGNYNNGVICSFGRVKAAHVTDGLGNTLLCAERPVRSSNVLELISGDNPCDTANDNGGGWLSGSGWWTPLSSQAPEIFIQGFPYGGCGIGGFGSRHGNTFGAAFCDGSVRHVGFEIDAVTVWRPLGSRNGRESVNLPW